MQFRPQQRTYITYDFINLRPTPCLSFSPVTILINLEGRWKKILCLRWISNIIFLFLVPMTVLKQPLYSIRKADKGKTNGRNASAHSRREHLSDTELMAKTWRANKARTAGVDCWWNGSPRRCFSYSCGLIWSVTTDPVVSMISDRELLVESPDRANYLYLLGVYIKKFLAPVFHPRTSESTIRVPLDYESGGNIVHLCLCTLTIGEEFRCSYIR